MRGGMYVTHAEARRAACPRRPPNVHPAAKGRMHPNPDRGNGTAQPDIFAKIRKKDR